ncbi:hypothetical protein D3C77_391920 [compost metagenome]
MEILGLGFVGTDRRQPVQALQQLILQRTNLRLNVFCLARLTEHGINLHQVAQGFQIATQRQTVAQQFQALQLNFSGMKLRIGVTDQVIVGHQHGQEKQDTYQAEFHPETQPIHQRDGRIQQALHG